MTPDTLHTVFCRESGLSVHFRLGPADTRCERAWMEFLKVFTEADLVLVIQTLKRKIKSGDRRPGCLRFSNLIERLDLFDEELAMAKAQARNARQPLSNRDAILKATGRPVEAQATVTTPRVILGDKEADWIARMREAAK